MKKRLCAMILTIAMLLTTVVPVFAETGITISKNSITIQSGDTYQLKVLVNGQVVSAGAWGSSDTNVATVSQTGLVTGKAAGSAVITAMVQGTSVECLVSVVKRSTNQTTRYNVLILDMSGSMSGTPVKRQNEAAKRFCKTILSSAGNNHIALISLGKTSTVLSNFTTDLDTLSKAISKAKKTGGTNINHALVTAGKLLKKVPNGSGVMKNVILCSDGLPKDGSKAAKGRYKSKDHKYYKYANSTYATDVKLKKKGYFIYALGFFHNCKGNNLKFGKRLMKDLASKDKYYIVTKPEDIDKTLNDIAQTITKTTMNKTAITLYTGETYQLKVQVNGSVKKAKWKSLRPSIATVNSSGKVTAKKAGTTTIKGTVNGKTVTCKVTVKQKKTAVKPKIKLDRSKATVYVGKTIKLKATVTGKSKKVKWTTSNKGIATVSKGTVKGIKEGKVTITATANGVKATCIVTVKIKHPTYSQYFMVKTQKSRYGSKKINEYGCRLVVNEGAKIEKCAVYLKKNSYGYERTIACKGTGITYATYVPYLALNGKIIYDGLNTSQIYTYSLRPDRNGVWSRNASYGLITANLRDTKGRNLSVKSTGVAGKNTKIFYDLGKMKEWLNK